MTTRETERKIDLLQGEIHGLMDVLVVLMANIANLQAAGSSFEEKLSEFDRHLEILAKSTKKRSGGDTGQGALDVIQVIREKLARMAHNSSSLS